MNKYTIVHIENSNIYLKIIGRFFEKVENVDYFPLYVNSQKDAWEQIKKFSPTPDLFIVDLMLNDDVDPQPGVDLILKIKENHKFQNSKIMVLTATVQEYPKTQLTGQDVYYYLKTFRPRYFLEEVIAILKRDEKPNA